MSTTQRMRALPVGGIAKLAVTALGLSLLIVPLATRETTAQDAHAADPITTASIGNGDAASSVSSADDGAMARKIRDDLDFQRASRAYLWARPFVGGTAQGLAYWERLSDIVQRLPMAQIDRAMLTSLKPLGIERGKPFRPDERQKRLLELGAAMGELKARAGAGRP